jgi:hypothetical protein
LTSAATAVRMDNVRRKQKGIKDEKKESHLSSERLRRMPRSYVSTVDAVVGITNFDSYQSGQWFRLPNQKRKVRLARHRPTGDVFFVSGNKHRPTLSLGEFRLACGKPAKVVLPAAR